MKIVAKPIKAVAIFEYEDSQKPPMPYKFKLKEETGEETTIFVGRFLSVEKSRLAGEECFIYQCQSVIDGVEMRYELKYIIPRCVWQLYKI